MVSIEKYKCFCKDGVSQTLPTVAIKEVCTRWFYNQGTVSVGFSILYFNIMRNCVKVTNPWQSSFLSI